jgi:hypothetical protein
VKQLSHSTIYRRSPFILSLISKSLSLLFSASSVLKVFPGKA